MDPKDFRELVSKRQSIRYFEKDRDIPLNIIEEIIDDAQQAPNDCNRQSWKFVVVRDKSIRERIVREAGGCKPTVRASVLIVPIIQMGWNHSKFSIIQTLAAATNTLILSARTRGIAGVWMAGIGGTEQIRKILKIPPYYIIDNFVALGYAEDSPWPKPPRPDVEKIYSVNEFNFDKNLIYPLRESEKYDFWEITNKNNPYAEWNPSKWSLNQIALFRGNSVWSDSPSKTIHRSKRLRLEFEKEVRIALDNLNPGKTLLLLPFSGAYSAALLKDQADIDLTHFELNPGHELMIKKRLEREDVRSDVPFSSGDNTNNLLKTPFPNDSFDNILLFQGLEGLTEPDTLLTEVERLLKPGGRFITTVRNKWSWFFLLFKSKIVREQVWNLGPYWPMTPFKLRSLLTGFSGKFIGLTPLPLNSFVGRSMKSFPLNYLSRLLVFVGEKK